MGGIAFTVAFTAQTTVTSSPLSADITEHLFLPFLCDNLLGCLHCSHTSFVHHVWRKVIPEMRLWRWLCVCKCQFCYSGQKTL